jgi:putative ATP-dependent endonuclease of OLD family
MEGEHISTVRILCKYMMIIESVRIKNFRSIYDETLHCDELTALIGPNGSGKSSFLRALEMFYTSNARYFEDDFYNRDTSENIIITMTFTGLMEDEKRLFKKYVEGDKLTVEKEIKWPPSRGSQSYYGTSLQNPEFDSFRSASGTGLRTEYNKLRENRFDLPDYSNKDNAETALEAWEETHSDQCVRRRDAGQFFGFKEVGEAHLEKFTRFILVPAVRDASEDAAEKKGTPLAEIMDLVVRSVLAQRKEIKELQEGVQKKYEEIVDPNKLGELKDLEQNLNDTLKTYVPDAGVELAWLAGDVIDIPMPKADIKLVEDEYPSSVERTGHGLQRAFILTMLQHLTKAQSSFKTAERVGEETETVESSGCSLILPSLIIGIEEPELYQHPNRQRHLSKILLKLATGSIKGVADFTQIIYTTHSPLFVDIKRFDKIRVLRKIKEENDKPKRTRVISTNLDKVAKIIEMADGKPEGTYSGRTLEPRLQTLMTPWLNEGFFADVAVLVEGEEDRAAILGIATTQGHDLESIGISVIPCMGKTNLDRPTAIFKELGIEVYTIWDGDYEGKDAKPGENHRLLRLFNQPIEDWPEKVTEHFACFKKKLNTTLKNEIGEIPFSSYLDKACQCLCLDKNKYALKNPQVIHEIINEAQKQGESSETLERIVEQIVALKKPGSASE